MVTIVERMAKSPSLRSTPLQLYVLKEMKK